MSLHEALDPLFEGIDGISTAFGALVWTALGAWAIVSIIIYLPLKRLRAQRTELENVWPEVLGELAENLRAGMGVESALDTCVAPTAPDSSLSLPGRTPQNDRLTGLV